MRAELWLSDFTFPSFKIRIYMLEKIMQYFHNANITGAHSPETGLSCGFLIFSFARAASCEPVYCRFRLLPFTCPRALEQN